MNFPTYICLLGVFLFLGCGVTPSDERSGQSNNLQAIAGSNGDSDGESNDAQSAADSTCKSSKATDIQTTNDSLYDLVVQPILESNCVSCHGAGKITPDLSTKELATANGQSILATVKDGSMPPGGGLSDSDTASLDDWLNAGFSLFDPATVTYEKDIAPLFGTKCVMCHSSTATSNRHDPYLTSYDLAKSGASESLKEMSQGSMPTRNSGLKLGADDIGILTAWIDGGYVRGTPPPPVDTTGGAVYYDTVRTLMSARCSTCHQPGLTGPDLSTYDTAVAGAPRSWIRITAGTMPPAGSIPQTEKDVFKAWIDAQYPQGTPPDGPLPPPPPPPPSTPPPPPPAADAAAVYNETIKTLLAARCTTCHQQGLTAPDLSTYETAVAGADRSWVRIADGTMPPAGAIPQAEQNLYKAWIDAQFPEGTATTVTDPVADPSSDTDSASDAGVVDAINDCP